VGCDAQRAIANGARVIDMSFFGTAPCSPALQAAIDAAWSAGIVIVGIAGAGPPGSGGTSGQVFPANC
jgi:subtilisin family serine protease